MSEQLHIQSELARAPVPVLTRYAEGKLSVTEQAVVESFMEENPLYADALEGLQSLPDPATATAAAAIDIRARTTRLLKQKRKPRINSFNFMQYATAAVAVLVVLFVASSAIYINFRIGQDRHASAPMLAERSDDALGNGNGIANNTSPREEQAEKQPELVHKPVMGDDPQFTSVTPAESTPGNSIAPGLSASPLTEATPTDNASPTDALPSIGNTAPGRANNSYSDVLASDDFSPEPNAANDLKADTILVVNSPSLSDSKLLSYAGAFSEKEQQVIETALAMLSQPPRMDYDEVADGMDDAMLDAKVDATDEVLAEELISARSSPGNTAPTSTTVPDVTSGKKPSKKRTEAQKERARQQAEEEMRKDQEALGKNEAERGRRTELEQKKDQVLYIQGTFYFEKKEYKNAQGVFLDLLRTAPKDLNNWLYLGRSYRADGQVFKAIPCLKAVVDQGASPQFQLAQWELALAYLAAGKKPEAKAIFTAIQGAGGTYQAQAAEQLRKL